MTFQPHRTNVTVEYEILYGKVMRANAKDGGHRKSLPSIKHPDRVKLLEKEMAAVLEAMAEIGKPEITQIISEKACFTEDRTRKILQILKKHGKVTCQHTRYKREPKLWVLP